MPRLENLVAAVLDTHIWVWTCAGEAKAEAMQRFKGTPIVSAISVWEVSMLESKGRLNLSPDVDTWILQNLSPPVILEPISPAISIQSCRLPEFHGDPADRLIVATAMECGVPLITADRQIIDWNKRHQMLQLFTPA
jgi:PIN domain nuclease of toxin-antitoxin system